MKKSSIINNKDRYFRVLEIKDNKVLAIDCIKRTMPKWFMMSDFNSYQEISESDLLKYLGVELIDIEELPSENKRIAYERYTLIAPVLSFISDKNHQKKVISKICADKNISKQTIRKYLCIYLSFQNISALAPNCPPDEKKLSEDEKNMRWALNKFFYTKNKNSLKTAYTMMLKEKYCDNLGVLPDKYPSFYQFRYYYRKHKSLQTYYISRNGIKDYQRNNRPLTGNGIQEFAPAAGVGMLDSTICDIYLVDDSKNLVGRPILTACIDAYSGLCCGYALTWEGGMYSLKKLMLNVISEKTEWCKQFGVSIKDEDWNCKSLPATLVTDMGAEYKSTNFENITELGVTLINLPPYRPELKGAVEKFFDVIQSSYKPYLKGKGVIEPDFQERGVHDYRKDACLTMELFEKIVLNCIIYYNTKRVIKSFPYTQEMLNQNIQPYSNNIWNWSIGQAGANLIPITKRDLLLTLLPRTTGVFGRMGLKVNKLRYNNDEYTEEFLKGGTVTVAYNPDDVSCIWLINNGEYIKFDLIETRFENKSIEEVNNICELQKSIVANSEQESVQAKINLALHIETIVNNVEKSQSINIKNINSTRRKERNKNHIDYMKASEYIELPY